ncbi:MAG: creatininase family protein [Candidatus Micrarchaeota archaeon]|nr:creatininase family protein [Candidatus Micrarchaeota archaeon]
MEKPLLFGEMTSLQLARFLKAEKKPVAIIPMGATEAHGSHLPLWTDSIAPYELAKRVSARTGAIVLPPINYGFCYTLRKWPGTISLKSQTFSSLIRDIARELVRNGFDRLLFLNGHGANASIAGHVLSELADEFCGPPSHSRLLRKSPSCPTFKACIVSWWEIKELEKMCGPIGHADENEESIVLALSEWEKKPSKQEASRKFLGKVVPLPAGQFTKYGYIGKVGGGSLEKGKQMEKVIVNKLVKLVEADLSYEEVD